MPNTGSGPSDLNPAGVYPPTDNKRELRATSKSYPIESRHTETPLPSSLYRFMGITADPDPPKTEGASIFQSIENPYALQQAVNRLEDSLDEIILMFRGERDTLASDGGFEKGKEG